jgi:hypothetical protein
MGGAERFPPFFFRFAPDWNHFDRQNLKTDKLFSFLFTMGCHYALGKQIVNERHDGLSCTPLIFFIGKPSAPFL